MVELGILADDEPVELLHCGHPDDAPPGAGALGVVRGQELA